MSTISSYISNNKKFVDEYKLGKQPLPPSKQIAVVTCMDARIDIYRALGINLGESHVIRNAGGLAKDALRSLVISEQLLGTKQIILLHHSDCGMLTFKQEDAVAVVKKNIGQDASSIDFQPFPNLEQSVRDDVAFLKNSPLIPDDIKIWGGIYHVETGEVTEVK